MRRKRDRRGESQEESQEKRREETQSSRTADIRRARVPLLVVFETSPVHIGREIGNQKIISHFDGRAEAQNDTAWTQHDADRSKLQSYGSREGFGAVKLCGVISHSPRCFGPFCWRIVHVYGGLQNHPEVTVPL